MYPQFLAVRMIYSTLCDRRAGLYGKELRIWTLEHHKPGALPNSKGADQDGRVLPSGRRSPGTGNRCKHFPA